MLQIRSIPFRRWLKKRGFAHLRCFWFGIGSLKGNTSSSSKNSYLGNVPVSPFPQKPQLYFELWYFWLYILIVETMSQGIIKAEKEKYKWKM